jgi:hypothetical protein
MMSSRLALAARLRGLAIAALALAGFLHRKQVGSGENNVV